MSLEGDYRISILIINGPAVHTILNLRFSEKKLSNLIFLNVIVNTCCEQVTCYRYFGGSSTGSP